MMYEIYKEATFSSAHSLRGYQGKCESLHGHNWRIRAHVSARHLNHLGMVIDFKELSTHLKNTLEPLDHHNLNDIPPFDTINPSAENIAKHLFETLSALINDDRVAVTKIMVWESDASCATYYEA